MTSAVPQPRPLSTNILQPVSLDKTLSCHAGVHKWKRAALLLISSWSQRPSGHAADPPASAEPGVLMASRHAGWTTPKEPFFFSPRGLRKD